MVIIVLKNNSNILLKHVLVKTINLKKYIFKNKKLILKKAFQLKLVTTDDKCRLFIFNNYSEVSPYILC